MGARKGIKLDRKSLGIIHLRFQKLLSHWCVDDGSIDRLSMHRIDDEREAYGNKLRIIETKKSHFFFANLKSLDDLDVV